MTLYGEDPAERPDIYGKVGNSGVSIATVDDAKKLYSGFDLCAPTTSVSMTINGPAPMLLAFFMNAAIDQQVEKHLRETGGWEAAQAKLDAHFAQVGGRPVYGAEIPEGNDGLGLGLLGVSGDQVVDAETYARIREHTLRTVRGTVQADILKEDQAQNTCIFSTEFALKMMGDVQQFFVDHEVRNFYSVSISGYHIAEAGANPISPAGVHPGQRVHDTWSPTWPAGMKIDDFAPNLSFFFSNGMDAEYTVIGRVARRIWATRHAGPLRRRRALPEAEVPRADVRAVAARPGDPASTTSAPRCRRCTRSSTTPTRCTPTPTTRRSPPRPRNRCAARSRSS